MIQLLIIAERVSARHVIVKYCVEFVCLYVYMSRLGMQSAQYGEGHTVVLYARAPGVHVLS